MTDILVRKTPIIVGAQTSWSALTRAARVLVGVESWMRFWRNWNHFVATGPKTAIFLLLFRENEGGMRERGLGWTYHPRTKPSVQFGLHHDWAGPSSRRLAGRARHLPRRGSGGISFSAALKECDEDRLKLTAVVRLCVKRGRWIRHLWYLGDWYR